MPAAAQAPPPDNTPDDTPGAVPVIVGAVVPGSPPDSRGDDALTREQQRADLAEVQATAARVEAAEARTLAEQRAVDLMVAVERAAKAEGQVEGLREALAESRRPAWRRWLGLPVS